MQLINMKDDLMKYVPQDSGQIIEDTKEAKKRLLSISVIEKENFEKDGKHTFEKLPKPKPIKQICSGRVGISAERKRASRNIEVDINSKKQKQRKVSCIFLSFSILRMVFY